MPEVAALQRIVGQPRVREFLEAAVLEGRLSHAYLFVGAPGSGKLDAAWALASCIVCPNGGDGTCDECIRVSHRTHPDVHLLEPASVVGYVVDQVHELMEDVQMAPMRARAKVYIVNRADLLRDRAANALLKTIEEPPAGVYFILLGRSVDAILPTIVSRCQQVPFRIVPTADGIAQLVRRCGASEVDAAVALAVAGTPERAVTYLGSPKRQEVRRLMVRTLSELPADDTWDVLRSADDLYTAVLDAAGMLDERGRRRKRDDVVKTEVRERTRDVEDYLSAAALRQLEVDARRTISARERSGMMEALAAAESLLRDCLVAREGAPGGITNQDAAATVEAIAARTGTDGLVRALEAVTRAGDDLAHNVTPQVALEAMLIAVKEALTCPPSSR
ncbi:MAG: DNA polymerase III subunit delta' [Olsenella sp.]|nr:DNA polymerase III subunit delta' [Olsenella sp.]